VVYDAVEAAVELSRLYSIPVILGSATPKLEHYWRAKNGEYNLVELRGRFSPRPSLEVVDMKRERRKGSLALRTLERMKSTLSSGKRVMVFVRRKGLGRVVCRRCGYTPKCPKCDVRLTLHEGSGTLRCHVCGFEVEAPSLCPVCGYPLSVVGTGTEKVEKELRRFFPKRRIARADRETLSRPDSIVKILRSLSDFLDPILEERFRAVSRNLEDGVDFPIPENDFLISEMIRRAFKKRIGYTPDWEKIQAVLEGMGKTSFRLVFKGNIGVWKSFDRIFVGKVLKEPFEVELRTGRMEIGDFVFQVGEKTEEALDWISLNLKNVRGVLRFRSRRKGDKIGGRKLKDFLISRRVYAYMRDSIPLLVDDEGIIWVPGLWKDGKRMGGKLVVNLLRSPLKGGRA